MAGIFAGIRYKLQDSPSSALLAQRPPPAAAAAPALPVWQYAHVRQP